jgi:hypothetical protein
MIYHRGVEITEMLIIVLRLAGFVMPIDRLAYGGHRKVMGK